MPGRVAHPMRRPMVLSVCVRTVCWLLGTGGWPGTNCICQKRQWLGIRKGRADPQILLICETRARASENDSKKERSLCQQKKCKKCAHVDVQSRSTLDSTAEEPKELGGPGLVDAATDVVQPAVDRQGIHWLGDALEGRRRSVEIPPLCIYWRT